MRRNWLGLALLCGAANMLSPPAASASEVIFNGSMTGTATGALAPNCAPLPRRSTLTGTGTSSLGNFSYFHQVCLAGVGPIRGNFLFSFSGGDTLQGAIEGAAVAGASAGLFDINLAYRILGGTGQFSGASGAFNGVGLVDQRNLPTTRVSISFDGVPEPATWAMMILGFGAIGISLRGQRRLGAEVLRRA